MTEKSADEVLARMDAVYRKAGDDMWETPAGAHAIRLLGAQESVTVSDIIASLEREAAGDRRLKAMYDRVIARLRDLEAQRRSG